MVAATLIHGWYSAPLTSIRVKALTSIVTIPEWCTTVHTNTANKTTNCIKFAYKKQAIKDLCPVITSRGYSNSLGYFSTSTLRLNDDQDSTRLIFYFVHRVRIQQPGTTHCHVSHTFININKIQSFCQLYKCH